MLDACVEFLQQMELIDQFNTTQENTCVFQVNMSKERVELDICKYCNMKHERDRNKCSAFGQVCRSCKKLKHFSSISRFKNKTQTVEQVPKEVFEIQ